RRTVRNRDEHCVITETKPMKRDRGMDYTGFEVAHIFPIAWAGKVVEYLARDDAKHKIQSLVDTREEGDRARNAFLLRADIHKLFDQYVWSIY
ncbi:hypothetical protein LXA43DRAFT_848379, partial [Ganoderma leucocontextum]